MRFAPLCLAALLLAPAPAGARRAREEEAPQEETAEDRLNLVALLIKDGHWDRAAAVLSGIAPTDDGIDPARYATLSGLLAFQGGRWEDAVTSLSRARDLGAAEPKLGLYVALGLVELGLFQAAVLEGRGLLGEEPEPWILLGEGLRRARQPAEAAVLLEEARLRFPERSDLSLQLAGALVEAGRPLAAGMLLERETRRDPDLAREGAECLRRAGRVARALALNARVPDPGERYRQRLGLLLEGEDWERAAALEERLARTGGLDDDDVVYAVAYARFRVGDLDGAGRLLTAIRSPAAFERATALREAIASCEEEPARCD